MKNREYDGVRGGHRFLRRFEDLFDSLGSLQLHYPSEFLATSHAARR
jgi:hypothetical protein